MGPALGRNGNPIRDKDQPQSRSPNTVMGALKFWGFFLYTAIAPAE